MASSDWIEIYRAYESEELAAEILSLRKSLAGGFVQQGSGSVSNQRDLTELRDRLKAATRVTGERSGGRRLSSRVATVDFSDTRGL